MVVVPLEDYENVSQKIVLNELLLVYFLAHHHPLQYIQHKLHKAHRMVTDTEHHQNLQRLNPKLFLRLEQVIDKFDDQNNKRMRSALGVVLEEVLKVEGFWGLLVGVVEIDDVGGDVRMEVVVHAAPVDVDGLELLDDVVHDVLDSIDVEVEAGVELVHDADQLGEFFDHFDVDNIFDVEFPDQIPEELFF